MSAKAAIELELNEKILLVLREHPFLLLFKLFVWLLIAVLPLIIDALAAPYFISLSERVINTWVLFKDLYFLFSALGLFIILLLYNLNVHIVSNKRVVDIDQLNLTRHRAIETHIDRIQDVSAELKGVFGHIFNYGNVRVQSAGEQAKIVFENVPNPSNVKRMILDTFYARPKHLNEHSSSQ
ncbi:MAG: hypothetical protein A3J48_02670 [Candidatus Doudnabacteria bacterium RIFCSPHIGHO2_02_FULL_46_11]|uniref:YdbS-like PH domain-containing protein n=1 Tax=Candidatus Doudnabacteria bacterium RIFCSPHIGHO2_02_FULL_46_11 TaxID=1817832 RepID=A0A1F5P848_9BACT|nr:MAG: hypothetical protein A3J48_02670 [Candidatus Doudnabacteria bacterium RIFCSPHIGHO2_02_FULL_46_11]